jgi:rhodanese-related sulfurtransferase
MNTGTHESRRASARHQVTRSRSARRALGLGMVLLGAFAVVAAVPAAEPAASAAKPAPAAAAPASAPAKVTPMTQEQLLEHQAKHPAHLFVLDVRSPEEFREGHVPGAVNIPYDQMAARLSEVPKDKDVVLYCRSGRRAGIAAGVLQSNGYTRLSHLEGDMLAWTEQGRPVTKP